MPEIPLKHSVLDSNSGRGNDFVRLRDVDKEFQARLDAMAEFANQQNEAVKRLDRHHQSFHGARSRRIVNKAPANRVSYQPKTHKRYKI